MYSVGEFNIFAQAIYNYLAIFSLKKEEFNEKNIPYN